MNSPPTPEPTTPPSAPITDLTTPDPSWLTRPFRLLTVADAADAERLRTPAAAVPADWLTRHEGLLTQFAERLLAHTEHGKAAGYAAPQLDVPLQLFCFAPQHGEVTDPWRTVVVNPRVIRRWPQTQNGLELCFSCPDDQRRVTRWDKIRVTADWWYRAGAWTAGDVHTLRGWDARVWQHEHDHCRGRIIADHGTPARA